MKKLLYYMIFAVAACGISACDEGDDIWNKESSIKIITDFGFAGTDADTITVDFAKGEVLNFEGEWANETDWEIVIVGKESQKTDTIRGYSKSLEGVSWNGMATNHGMKYFPSSVLKEKINVDLFGVDDVADESTFLAGESCIVTLRFPDFFGTDTSKTVLKIASAVEEKFTAKDYLVFGNWENNYLVPIWAEPGNGLTATFTPESDGVDIVPEGKKFYVMEGIEPGDKWYIGGGAFRYAQTTNWAVQSGFYPITLEDTATTYINFFMYGYPGYCERSGLFLSFMNGTEDNGPKAELKVQGERIFVSEGWHGISIPVSRFIPTDDRFDFNKIDNIGFVLFSDGTKGEVKLAVDYFTITKKRPLFPVIK